MHFFNEIKPIAATAATSTSAATIAITKLFGVIYWSDRGLGPGLGFGLGLAVDPTVCFGVGLTLGLGVGSCLCPERNKQARVSYTIVFF